MALGAQFIPEDKVREIRETCSIVAVISDYVSLKKVGVNHKGLCPFHGEKTPSFFVNENRKFFHCFGCGMSGDVFTFLMKHDNVSFAEAARMLAKRFNIYLPEKPLTLTQQKRLSEREEYLQINQAAAAFYHKLLLHDARGKIARSYLEQRGLRQEMLEEYCIGYAPEAWDSLVNFLRSEKISLAAANRIGLIINKGKDQFYDRFRSRILFPILNVSRQIIGFGGRIITEGEPKYLNSPESVLYTKRASLYGLHSAASAIQKQNRVIVVEGYFDLLTLHQAGIKNAVAALGTALTEQQIQTLKRYTSDIITVFDADPSGEKAMIRSLEPLLKCSVAPRLVVLPEGEDPDSFTRKHGGDAFREKIDAAAALLDFVMEKIIQKHDIATPRGKVTACDEIVPLLALITDTMERDLYIQKTAQRLGVAEAQLRSRSKAGSQKLSPAVLQQPPAESSLDFRKDAEAVILKLMTIHPETIAIIDRDSLLDEFLSPELKKIGAALITCYRQQGDINLGFVTELLAEPPLQRLLAHLAFQQDVAGPQPQKILEDCIRSLRLKKISKERHRITLLLKQAEAAHDESSTIKFQKQYLQLVEEQKKVSRFRLDFLQA